MADICMTVDTALGEVPVNILPLIDDTDFKTIEAAVVYNAAGLALFWNFVTTAGAQTCTAVTPTSGGDYDWTDQGTSGMYAIEIPASGGASINNDTEGYGWFSGVATGVLPWRGPVIEFRSALLNNSLVNGTDNLQVDLIQIDGAATNGNNATLNLLKLNIVNNAGSAIVASSTGSNGHGIAASGNGSGDGLKATAGATGIGFEAVGGATDGNGMQATSPTNGYGMRLVGAGAFPGLACVGGSTGGGIIASATGGNNPGIGSFGSGSGAGMKALGGASNGPGLEVTGGLTNSHGIVATGAGSGDGLKAVSGATGNGINAIGGGTSGDGIVASAAGSGLDINAPNSDIGIAVIADGVWDEQLSGHTTAGSAGKALSDAGSSGDPWGTALPGAYASGTAGHIVGTALPDIAPGSANGLLRGGTNAATSITTALTANLIGNITGNLSGSVGSVTGAVGSVTGAVGSVTGNVGGNVTGSVGSVVGAVGSVTAAVTVGTNNDKTGYRLSATGVDDVWDDAVDGSVTARQSLRLANSANGAIVAGAATTTVTIRDLADTKDRVTAVVDASGNRTSVTRDLT